MKWTAIGAAAMLAAGAPALADPPATACPATSVAPPAELAGWAQRHSVDAAVGVAQAPVVAIGQAADVALAPAAGVAFAVPLGRPAAAGDRGGLVTFDVAVAGTYRIAIGARGWIDVVRGGQALASVAHSHGPACSGIAKIVDFTLRPGRHILQLSASPVAILPVMIVRLR